jgi:predicted nucleic acid-binding protein
MRWIIDTSAWSRRRLPEVDRQIKELLAEDETNELVLSPAVELELLREPQGDRVGETRASLEAAMDMLEATAETFELASDAMQTLGEYQRFAHRRPVPDLITAALAHQHECGVIHLDGDFDILADHAGLSFPVFRIELDDDGSPGGGRAAHPAAKQRQLRNELAALTSQMPIEDAETFLADALERARERVPGSTRRIGQS